MQYAPVDAVKKLYMVKQKQQGSEHLKPYCFMFICSLFCSSICFSYLGPAFYLFQLIYNIQGYIDTAKSN